MKIKTHNNWLTTADFKKVSEVKEKAKFKNHSACSANASDARISNKTASAHSEYRTSAPAND